MTQRAQLERDVLSALLSSPKDALRVRSIVRPEFVRDGLARRGIEALYECLDEGTEPTVGNVALHGGLSLEERVELGGSQYQPTNLRLITRKFTESVLREKLEELAAHIDTGGDVLTLVDEMRKTETEAAALIDLHRRPTMTDQIESFSREVTERLPKIPTGIDSLDALLGGGLETGGLTLLAGLPGSGKTSFALQLSLYAARHGTRVSFIEGEMTSSELISRLNGIATGVSVREIQSGEKFKELSFPFLSELDALPFDIRPSHERRLEVLIQEVRAAIAGGSRLIVADYMQTWSAGRTSDELFLGIRRTSQSLRSIALESGAHLLVLSALNRKEAGTGKITLASLYGSSSLEYDASQVLVLTSDEPDDLMEFKEPERAVTLRLLKQRNGPRGALALRYRLDSQRFDEATGPVGGNDEEERI